MRVGGRGSGVRGVSSHHSPGGPGGPGGSDPEVPLLSSPHITVTAELGPRSWLHFSPSKQPERKGGGCLRGWAGESSWRVREVCPEDSRPGRKGLPSLNPGRAGVRGPGGGVVSRVCPDQGLWTGRQSAGSTCKDRSLAAVINIPPRPGESRYRARSKSQSHDFSFGFLP